jgi:maleate isomerase
MGYEDDAGRGLAKRANQGDAKGAGMSGRDYGSRGRIGVCTPQANPTVEPEMTVCLPRGVTMLTTRLTSHSPDSRQRIQDYYDHLDRTLDSYDTLKLDALAFACTASSYLVGLEREKREIAALSAKRGYSIVTGGQAIVAALRTLGVSRIAVGAPYPAWVLDAARAYYTAAGFEIVAMQQIVTRTTDTRTIYELGGDDAIAAVKTLDLSRAEAVLFTGSGMPTLRAILAVQMDTGLPALGTNLCLAWQMAQVLGLDGPAGPHALWNGWQDRLNDL